MAGPARPFAAEVDWWPAATGPFLWQAYDALVVERDLDAIAAAGIRSVRVPLAWDSFMPDDSGVDRRRAAELNHLLRSASARSLLITLLMFAWSCGDCVQLPAYTVLRRRPRRGVRVLSGGRVEPGGPRDMYTDPLMLELADRWLRRLVADVGGHPALAAIDLGGDPAATIRPRRIGDLRRWVAMHAPAVRGAGHEVRLTLGAGDVLAARGVRLDGLDADRLDLAVAPPDLPDLDLPPADAVLLVTALAARLAGRGVVAALTVPRSGEPDPVETRDTLVEEIAARRAEAGLLGVRLGAWHDVDAALEGRPPFDRRDWLMRCGLGDGAAAPVRAALGELARRDLDAPALPGWPASFDAAEHYRHVDESRRELASQWRREHVERPGIVADR